MDSNVYIGLPLIVMDAKCGSLQKYSHIFVSRFLSPPREKNSLMMALYHTLDFSIDDIERNLISSNGIGTGSSREIYKVTIPGGEKLEDNWTWSSFGFGAFSYAIQRLGSMQYKNMKTIT